MLIVQNFLRNGGTLEVLESQYGIKANPHPTDKRCILNYNQIESPKLNDMVRECRGLVLELDSYNLVARAFKRFFNYGESLEDDGQFNWDNFSTMEKIDGSLILLYYYNGSWHSNTRNSFSTGYVTNSGLTWRDLFELAFDIDNLQYLNPELTYVCELVSRHNKIVRDYPEPQLFLLACFNKTEEVSVVNQELFAKPETYTFTNVEEIKQYIEDRSANDCTYEGVVIRDSANNRLKLKAKFYVKLHKTYNNGLLKTRHLLEMFLENEHDEFLLFFPEFQLKIQNIHEIVVSSVERVEQRLRELVKCETQKEFAMAILDDPLKSIMFTCRKTGMSALECIRQNQKHFSEYIDKVIRSNNV